MAVSLQFCCQNECHSDPKDTTISLARAPQTKMQTRSTFYPFAMTKFCVQLLANCYAPPSPNHFQTSSLKRDIQSGTFSWRVHSDKSSHDMEWYPLLALNFRTSFSSDWQWGPSNDISSLCEKLTKTVRWHVMICHLSIIKLWKFRHQIIFNPTDDQR